MSATTTKTPAKIKPIKTTKENALDKTTGDPIEASQWRNLWFSTKGKSYRDEVIHNSEQECEAQQKRLRDAIDESVVSQLFGMIVTLDGVFPAKNYSHGVAMPISGN